MCGIAVTTSDEGKNVEFINQALKRLGYRGYDSYGFVSFDNGLIVRTLKELGKFNTIPEYNKKESIILAHNRWASSGGINFENTHPIQYKDVYVVHNGNLLHDMTNFTSDTNFLANLLYDNWERLKQFEGFFRKFDSPNAFIAYNLKKRELIGFTNGPSLYYTKNGYFGSDPCIFEGFSDCYSTIPPNEIVDLYALKNTEQSIVTKSEQKENSMLDEIKQQPALFTRRPYFDIRLIDNPAHITLLGCGSSYNAGLLGRIYFEELVDSIVSVEYASEFIHHLRINPNSEYIALSQSGETKDVIEAVKIIKAAKKKVHSLVNNDYSQLVRLSDSRWNIEAGHENAVAATKTFSLQCISLLQIASQLSGINVSELDNLSKKAQQVIDLEPQIKELAKTFSKSYNCLLLGKYQNYPAALEGALKLKEVAQIHAEGMLSSEIKHGPLALVDKEMPVVVFIPSDNGKTQEALQNIREIHSRDGNIIAVVDCISKENVKDYVNQMIEIPVSSIYIQPILCSIVIQILSYYCSIEKGLNPERPRALAKSVTV